MLRLRMYALVWPKKAARRSARQFVALAGFSKGEQRKRFIARIDAPDKSWEFSLADIHARQYGKQYMQVYAQGLKATSTRRAPWYVVPADDKKNARLIVSPMVLDALKVLKLAYPKTTAKRRQELKAIRKQL